VRSSACLFALVIAASCGEPPASAPGAAGGAPGATAPASPEEIAAASPGAAVAPSPVPIAAANQAPSPAAAAAPGAAAAAGAAGASPAGGPTDVRLRAKLLSPLRATSGLGATPELVVAVSCPGVSICPLDFPATAKVLAPRIRFVDANGGVTAVVPDPKGTPLPTPGGVSATEYLQGFVPEAALAPDALYALDLTSDDRAVLTFTDASPEETSAAEDTQQAAAAQRIRVFSGSRPLPVEVQVASAGESPVASARVRFSEPVAAGSLVGGIAVIDRHGAVLPSCPWVPPAKACADPSSAQLSDVVDLVFSTPVAPADLAGGSLTVARAVHGGGRTVAEAAALAGRVLDPASDSLTLTLDQTMWVACGAKGEDSCFRDPMARWP
jgi:hypothetical protein